MLLHVSNCHIVLALWIPLQAAKRGWRYPQYVFMVYGWYREQWWYPEKEDNITCNIFQMEQAIERSLAINQCPEILDQSEITDIGMVNSVVTFIK